MRFTREVLVIASVCAPALAQQAAKFDASRYTLTPTQRSTDVPGTTVESEAPISIPGKPCAVANVIKPRANIDPQSILGSLAPSPSSNAVKNSLPELSVPAPSCADVSARKMKAARGQAPAKPPLVRPL